MKPSLPYRLFLLALTAATSLPGQNRPQSAETALAAFAKVADGTEGQRRRAARDLGQFAEPAVTALLLRQLGLAREPGYLQDLARALGKQLRPEAVEPLTSAIGSATNTWVRESLAEALGHQGAPGVAALSRLLQQDDGGKGVRAAVLAGLAVADGAEARALVIAAAASGPSRDRTAALRLLRKVTGDAAVDAVRIAASRERDWLLSAEALGQLARHDHPETMELAVQMHRRTKDTAPADVQTELLRGLLAAPTTEEHGQALLQRAALAEDALGAELEPRWRAALAHPTLAQFLLAAPPRTKAPERAIAARLLGWLGGEPAAAVLAALLSDRDYDVVAAAARALGEVGGEPAQKALNGLLAAGDGRAVPALVALQQLRQGDPTFTADLLKAARHKDPDARAVAMRLLATIDPGTGVAVGIENLAHKAWNVRLAAFQLLQQARAAAAVPALIARVDQEQGRIRSDLLDALQELTGQRCSTQALWEKWWRENGKDFAVAAERTAANPPKASAAPTTVSYFSVPVTSERVAFVLDTSGSMNQPMGTGGLTRLEEAVRQLGLVLERLSRSTRFNVITFGSKASAQAGKLMPLDDRSRAATMAALQELTPGTATNVHDGLLLALRDPDVDTVFLLTDGRPSAGPVVDPVALAAVVRQWNLPRGVRIHTVAIGSKSDLLEVLARESGGEHTVAK